MMWHDLPEFNEGVAAQQETELTQVAPVKELFPEVWSGLEEGKGAPDISKPEGPGPRGEGETPRSWSPVRMECRAGSHS